MPEAVDYKLHDLLGVAGATVGFILAGAILMGGFNAKYVHLFERYRGLTGEFRQHAAPDPRRGSLRDQIANYRRRIRVINIASVCVGFAMLLFLLTVAVASLSVIYPAVMKLRLVGSIGVIGGLSLGGLGVALDIVETLLSRGVIVEEVSDIPNLPADNTFTAAPTGQRRVGIDDPLLGDQRTHQGAQDWHLIDAKAIGLGLHTSTLVPARDPWGRHGLSPRGSLPCHLTPFPHRRRTHATPWLPFRLARRRPGTGRRDGS